MNIVQSLWPEILVYEYTFISIKKTSLLVLKYLVVNNSKLFLKELFSSHDLLLQSFLGMLLSQFIRTNYIITFIVAVDQWYWWTDTSVDP